MSQSIENKVVSRVYGQKRGWVLCPNSSKKIFGEI